MPVNVIINLVIYAVLLMDLLFIRLKIGYAASVAAKFITSLGFISLAINCSMHSNWDDICIAMIITGQIFGSIGDVLLEIKHFYPKVERKTLNLGFISFGIGHIFYIVTIILQARAVEISHIILYIFIAALLSAIGVFINNKMNRVMKLSVDGFEIQSGAYLFVLASVTLICISLSFASVSFIYGAIAFSLFLLSDFILSFIYFGGRKESKIFNVMNLIFYYVSQAMIAMYLLYKM